MTDHSRIQGPASDPASVRSSQNKHRQAGASARAPQAQTGHPAQAQAWAQGKTGSAPAAALLSSPAPGSPASPASIAPQPDRANDAPIRSTPTSEAAGEGAADTAGPVHQVVARLDTLTGRETLNLGDIVDAFGAAAFLPVLIVLGLIVVSPLSGIFLLPTFFGLAIFTTAVQMLVGKRRLWLPGVVRRRKISGRVLHGGLQRLTRLADRIDRAARVRLRALVAPPLDTFAKAACAICGLAMPTLELVPFSSSILALAVILFATALLTRDGLLVVVATATMAVAAMIPLTLYGGLIRAAADMAPG
ncbi:MAG: exopolysaccharide biosynthesis protein [Pseudomonadota bacterium]